MARPTAAPSLDAPISLTTGAIERLVCPAGKQQAFLRDTQVPGLKVRVTAAGAKAFVFERKVGQTTSRQTIGPVSTWTIEQARAEARRRAVAIDAGQDARLVGKTPARADLRAAEAWTSYVKDRKRFWGARHTADHERMADPGGRKVKRGEGVLVPGVLHDLLQRRLCDLTPDVIEAWAAKQAEARPTQARLALRLLRAFLVWCGEQSDLKALVSPGAASTRRVRDVAGRPGVKKDSLLREHLKPWFTEVCKMSPAAAVYVQALLITGARPNEMMGIEWDDVDFTWNSLALRDKVEGDRVIPLTPYLADQLWALPRISKRVFATRKGTAIAPPRKAHVRACLAADVPYVSFHGLRRSFKSLTEWLDVPTGVVAQIMGHKPSATAEKHYTVRPLDLLRVHHERIETWILEQGSIVFAKSNNRLSVVSK